MSFLAHAEPAQHPRGSLVAGVGRGGDPVQSQPVEGEVQQGGRRLGRVTEALRVRMQDHADLAVLVLGARPGQVGLADHSPGVAQLRRQRQGVARLGQGGHGEPAPDDLLGALRGRRWPVEIPQHVGPGAQVVQGGHVLAPEGTQQQPGRDQRSIDARHPAHGAAPGPRRQPSYGTFRTC